MYSHTAGKATLFLGVLVMNAGAKATDIPHSFASTNVQLFMTLEDVTDPYGLLQPQPGSVARNSSFALPRDIDYATGMSHNIRSSYCALKHLE